ncbi:MAG: RtcB family protein [Acidobacteria bacterium]|nr:RtcB family protein [Acidobacteriota bacterium]
MQQVDEVTWKIPRQGDMRVDGVFFASPPLLKLIREDQSLLQVANVATLPGIQKYSLAMPDIHWGYGFPIGGVAAFDVDNGVVSPGGVGYDINCGVRLLASNLEKGDVVPRMRDLVAGLFQNVPSGVGSRRKDLRLQRRDEVKVLEEGARWAVKQGYGEEEDLAAIESGGALPGADPAAVSDKALERGRSQVGTLGSGNHFIEIGYVDEVFDEETAAALGLFPGQVTVSVHTGSRGLGYQVCAESIGKLKRATIRYGFELPDPQLCCVPVKSPEGQEYLGAMAGAANFAFANRQLITHWVRESFAQVLRVPPRTHALRLIYDVAHNIAKIERHVIDGQEKTVCVHRKGATRSFPAGHPDLSPAYRVIGQPVLIPGDMGTASYVMLGTTTAMEKTFGSSCHGAGRVLSRKKAVQAAKGRSIQRELENRGVFVMAASRGTLAEEMPDAYKDVSQVVDTVHAAGISRKVARLRPLGVVKG